MRKITIRLDAKTHRLAKIQAAAAGVSLSQLIREHVRQAAAKASAETGILQRYAALEISSSDAMEMLGISCLEDLMARTVKEGFHLPRLDDQAARAMAQRFLRS